MPNPKQLEFIQQSISRMASNAGSAKNWSVVVVGAIVGVGIRETDARLVLVATYVALALAVLDAYYLAIERRFRDLYQAESAFAGSDRWGIRPGPVSWDDLKAAAKSPSVWIFHAIVIIGCLLALAAGLTS